MNASGSLAIRYFSHRDAFVWERRPSMNKTLPVAWPSFAPDGGAPGINVSCLSWSSHYFFPGSLEYGSECGSDGPAFVFRRPTQQLPTPPAATMALTPLNYFSSNLVLGGSKGASSGLRVAADQGACQQHGGRCQLYTTRALLLAREGLVRATRAMGSVLRQAWHTTRARGPGVTQLSYWNDNQAGYSWWSVGPDQMVWGLPQQIYLKLKAGYDAAGIPIRGWEPDNNFVVDYRNPKNWIGKDLMHYNRDLYPMGGEAFVAAMGNLSFTYYSNGFGADANMSIFKKYPITKANEPHPNVSFDFYSELLGYQAERLGAEMFFTDFLSYRGPAAQAYQDVPWGEEGEQLWLGGMAKAAGSLGMEVQFCMGAAHTIMESLQWPSVTNARINGDGGLDTEALILPSLLAATVGLGWSKDNLRTADKCYNAALFANGTVKYACDTGFKGENVNGRFAMQYQQTVLAALSGGPVGLSDQLSARPENVTATITTNVSLAMATCAATGDLLQPSYPLTPIERMIIQGGGMGDCTGPNHRAYTYGCGTNLLATYTAVPLAPAGVIALWWVAVGFTAGRGSLASWAMLYESDLAPMVDTSSIEAYPSPSFGEVPTGAFPGPGSSFPSGASAQGSYVVWEAQFIRQADGSCKHVVVSPWRGAHNMTMLNGPRGNEDGASLVNLAPIFGGIALLGEAGKVAAVSTYRFVKVEVSEGAGLRVTMRGKPAEMVSLLFARGDANVGYSCASETAVIGPEGVGVALLV